ncbi:MAG: hypothetical protein CMA49_08270 [Euryarchaeota archaeon]|nr:hypothetical protein [Euryarchaeota archaeon]
MAMVRNVRENLILSGAICIVFGAFLSVGGVLSMGAVIGVSGILLFIVGMSTSSQQTMNEEEIAAWTPSPEQLPDANRIMYRVDVTIDEPKKTTILCGSCGTVTELDGDRPRSFTCPACNTFLYEDEEE